MRGGIAAGPVSAEEEDSRRILAEPELVKAATESSSRSSEAPKATRAREKANPPICPKASTACLANTPPPLGRQFASPTTSPQSRARGARAPMSAGGARKTTQGTPARRTVRRRAEQRLEIVVENFPPTERGTSLQKSRSSQRLHPSVLSLHQHVPKHLFSQIARFLSRMLQQIRPPLKRRK
jgi:hypothetical protein